MLIDGDSEGIDDGSTVRLGAPVTGDEVTGACVNVPSDMYVMPPLNFLGRVLLPNGCSTAGPPYMIKLSSSTTMDLVELLPEW